MSFQTIGVDPLKAGNGSFHATFSVALHVLGSPFSALMPFIDGPRQWGQLSAAADAPTMEKRTRTRKDLRIPKCNVIIPSVVLHLLHPKPAASVIEDDLDHREP